jgi:hypothetical protein
VQDREQRRDDGLERDHERGQDEEEQHAAAAESQSCEAVTGQRREHHGEHCRASGDHEAVGDVLPDTDLTGVPERPVVVRGDPVRVERGRVSVASLGFFRDCETIVYSG